MEILKPEDTITEINNSPDKLENRMETTEENNLKIDQ